MRIGWSRHARERFFERSLKYGLNYGEVELNIKGQKVKVRQKHGTIKTIFKIVDDFFTVVKEETRKYINVISIWESNEEEVKLWLKKK